MGEHEPLYYCMSSGLRGEAVAYIRGEHPGYRLQEGTPIDNWVVPHFDIGGFDEETGRRTATGRLTDFLNDSVGWLIVDRRVRDILTEAGIGPQHVQWLNLCLHYGGAEHVGEYFVVNVLDRRRAVHPQESRFVGPTRVLTKTVLLREAVQGTELFRLDEWEARVYFSPRLKEALDRAGVTGVEWTATQVAD